MDGDSAVSSVGGSFSAERPSRRASFEADRAAYDQKANATYNRKSYTASLSKSRVILEERLQAAFFQVGAYFFVISLFTCWLCLEPQLSFLDSLYFTMATFTTIGCK